MADVSLWVPVLTALAGISGALGSQYVSHLLTRKREENVTATKREAELYFVSTQLVFLLEQFAEACAGVATDPGVRFRQRCGNRLLLNSMLLCSTVLLITISEEERSESARSVYPYLLCTSSCRN